MNEFFVTADGPQPIPNEVVSEGRDAVDRFVTAMGWEPPAAVAAAPETEQDEEEDADARFVLIRGTQVRVPKHVVAMGERAIHAFAAALSPVRVATPTPPVSPAAPAAGEE